MALGIILIMFITMAIIGVLGISFMYLTKSKKAENIIFYIMAFFGMFVAFVSATGFPSNYTMQILGAWAIGIVSIVGIIVRIKMKDKNLLLSKHLVAASVILGLLYLFFVKYNNICF